MNNKSRGERGRSDSPPAVGGTVYLRLSARHSSAFTFDLDPSPAKVKMTTATDRCTSNARIKHGCWGQVTLDFAYINSVGGSPVGRDFDLSKHLSPA